MPDGDARIAIASFVSYAKLPTKEFPLVPLANFFTEPLGVVDVKVLFILQLNSSVNVLPLQESSPVGEYTSNIFLGLLTPTEFLNSSLVASSYTLV